MKIIPIILVFLVTGCGAYVDGSTITRAEKECADKEGIQKMMVIDSTSTSEVLATVYCRDGSYTVIKQGYSAGGK